MIEESDCGSFAERGLYGSIEDKVTSVYLRLSQPDGEYQPTRITAAPDVYMMFASCLDAPVSPTTLMHVYDAVVDLDCELAHGSLKMWGGAVTLAVMDGWRE